jgi:hypothetical protein
MAFNITTFKTALQQGGARPNLFDVRIIYPSLIRDRIGAANEISRFMIKAAALPASTLGSYTVPYFGRQIKYGGDRTFEDWTVTVINDENFLIRNAMEAWSDLINSHESNTRSLPGVPGVSGISDGYKSTAEIFQYGKDGKPLRIYNFDGLYPINISDIAMSWETNDTIEEFTVTFQYDLWTVIRSEGRTGSSTT